MGGCVCLIINKSKRLPYFLTSVNLRINCAVIRMSYVTV